MVLLQEDLRMKCLLSIRADHMDHLHDDLPTKFHLMTWVTGNLKTRDMPLLHLYLLHK